MQQSERLQNYLEQACSQIESKKAHGKIISELTVQIEEKKQKYMQDGMNGLAAENRAIDEMDDPAAVGERFGKIQNQKKDWVEIIANIIIWTISGSIALFSLLFGIGIAWAMLSAQPGDIIIAVSVCGMIAFVGCVVAFLFLSIFKAVFNMLFYSIMAKDYVRRKKRGQYDDKY
jgi:ABC-type multidrug transport system permease subunit